MVKLPKAKLEYGCLSLKFMGTKIFMTSLWKLGNNASIKVLSQVWKVIQSNFSGIIDYIFFTLALNVAVYDLNVAVYDLNVAVYDLMQLGS